MSKTNVISNVDKEASKRKSNLLNVDTSCYENIIYNKKDIAIQLFDEFDKQVLNINNSIKRNYLMKNIAYKLNKKIIEVQVNTVDTLFNKLLVKINSIRSNVTSHYTKKVLCLKIKEILQSFQRRNMVFISDY
ncbi:MAG: hypothetical protein PUA68_04400 [Bacilli bacterium]|nr:hypothetical protein [Bacilli bacterium]